MSARQPQRFSQHAVWHKRTSLVGLRLYCSQTPAQKAWHCSDHRRSPLWQWHIMPREQSEREHWKDAIMDANHMFWVCLKAQESDWKAVWHLLCCLVCRSATLRGPAPRWSLALWVKLLQVIHLIPTAWSRHRLSSDILLGFLSCFTELIPVHLSGVLSFFFFTLLCYELSCLKTFLQIFASRVATQRQRSS